ncbi:2-octaprenylphenol hydroxylase [Nicoletella semolina]|uniref:2-octaprenylphenol hydroxylase n=1 Tax=Nicoletella semolina TaxID=271160 RepID=A0A4V2SJJ7_9PAST|nr:FAD-dependent monooxygenase [Nicoletella semolina]MDH2924100.1 FAD-dependent 2-octaprenylphenol hydroxylase [Nicoletella semolina]TCP15896.1 2-octaprenylphenol hydroxylase [Nicoletella semolina]
MKTADIVIVGGGMIGLALAALLAQSSCQIKIIEKSQPNLKGNSVQRVSAINAKSQQMFDRIGLWQYIPQEKRSPYHQMLIWEKDSFAKLHFEQQDSAIRQLGLAQLGFILDNHDIQHALYQLVNLQENVEILHTVPTNMSITENGAVLILENGEVIFTKLVVGADGANSWVRQQANIPLVSRDYSHSALVCQIKTEEAHQKMARQVFTSDSILALLPLPDKHYCSIVWSLPPEKAIQLLNCNEMEFNKALTVASNNQLGLCELQNPSKLQNPRAIYPLVARYARDFAQPRLALVGDAAHTIHPLAGLGVNLGFSDIIMLADAIQMSLVQERDIGEYRQLRQFERERKLDAMKMLATMETIKQIFTGENPLKKLLRGVGLTITNQLPVVKKLLIEQAINV